MLHAGTVERWVLEPPRLSADVVLRLQRYREPRLAPAEVRAIAEAVVVEATGLLVPEAVLWRGPVTRADPEGIVELACAHRFRSRLLARHLAGATDAYVLALTLGPALEARVEAMLAGRLLAEGYLMDTTAWAAILALGREVRARLFAVERPAGRSLTHRLAPGYGDWPVSDQPALLRVFGDAPLPVRVTDFAWLLPAKSITGLHGVVPAA